MIKSFADKEHSSFLSAADRSASPLNIQRAVRRLEYINLATDLNDLRVPPSNRLHALKGDQTASFSISVKEQWRICFRFIDGNAFNVEIADYH